MNNNVTNNASRGALHSLLRFRVPLGFVLAAWYLVVAKASEPVFFALGAALIIAGCALRSWAAGYLLKGKRVAVGGPYAFIRNPLYAGSFLIGLGCCLVLVQWPLPVTAWFFWAVFLVGFVGIYRAKTLAEEAELRDSLGAPYADYAHRVPAFWPVRGRVSDLGDQRFSWEIYRRNHEHQCLLGATAVLIFLLTRGRLGF